MSRQRSSSPSTLGGVIVDRFDRRKVMMLADLGRARPFKVKKVADSATRTIDFTAPAREVSDDLEESLVSNAGHNIDPNIVEAMAGDYASWPGYVKAHGMPDPELVSTLSGKAPETVAWLQTFGPKFDSSMYESLTEIGTPFATSRHTVASVRWVM